MSLPSCAAAGQNSTLFMAENTSQTWPPQLCRAQLPLRRTVEMGACLNHPAFFSHQTYFLDHYQSHNSHICLFETFKRGEGFTKHHGLPSSVLPLLHILLSFLLSQCPSSSFFLWLFPPTQDAVWASSMSTTICCHTDILNHMHLPGSSTVLGFEPLDSLPPTEVSIH